MKSDKNGSVPQLNQFVTERIRARAFQIFEARAGRPGDPIADWVQAEREIEGGSPSSPERAVPGSNGAIEARNRARGEALIRAGKE